MARSLLVSGLVVLFYLTAAAASEETTLADEDATPKELPERAVFEVAKQYTFGLGGGPQWKLLGNSIRDGRYGPRVTRTLEGGLPAFVFYDIHGKEVARQEVNGMSNAAIDGMLSTYGFFPGDTREAAAESVLPPSLLNPSSGGGCGARARKKRQAAAAAAAEAQGHKTAAELAEAAATAAQAAAKAATAAAAAAEAAVAALAAEQGPKDEGTCTA